ncbi:MAG: S8 family serine peptidase [Magnetococcales bacterium]|nr:S8 family serine peptidase [Magnetococcales bacterium]
MADFSGLKQQVEKILDEGGEQMEVIVQMASDPKQKKKLLEAAGTAISRRRFSLSSRDLLPEPFKKVASKKVKSESASTATILRTAAKSAALTLAAIKNSGLQPTNSLLEAGLVAKALERTLQPLTKGGKIPSPQRFWSSRAMPLRLMRDELSRLPKEVENIQAIHLNRRLSVPRIMETKALGIETDSILSSTWGLDQMNALAAWGTYGSKGKGVTIGLLDTGVDASHPDLKDKVAHWAEFNSMGEEIPGSQPRDSDIHGTHCAGTLVGGNQSGRYIGVAPEAKLAAALVLDGEVGGTDAQVLAGIDWAMEKGVDVISMSLGALDMDPVTPSTYTEAMLTCLQAGIPVVAAIGNEGEQTSGAPGSDPFVFAVGATDPQDRVAGFSGGRTQIIYQSNYINPAVLPLPYSKPELTAPGVSVRSSVPGGGYSFLNGTSMATPHVAGAIALLLSATTIRNKEHGADLAYLIKDLIMGSLEDMGESGQDHRYGFGRLDILRAIDFALDRGY